MMFQIDQVNADADKAFKYLIVDNPLDETNQDFSRRLIQECLQHLAIIDEKINHYSRAWTVGRMSSVDRNVMRIACGEILFLPETQPVIAINEAIEIAKRYGEENSGSFVNAILDKIMSESE